MRYGNFVRKTAIGMHHITYGPNTDDVDDTLVFLTAGELYKQGYRGTSNAYCNIARPDRDDWVIELARIMRRAPADFYVPGEETPANNWREHYIRSHTTDQLTVHPKVYDAMKKMRG